jgi:hypothetical protein
VAVLGACASPGMPPGGPEDKQAPQIVRIAPDSGKVDVTPSSVIFRFDEVVSERPSGAASLGALFLISPRDGEPRVDWHREEISVRPRRGWRKNTAYTITLLPGLSDLRGNARNTGAVTMFSTGATLPASHVTGTLYNWAEARVIPKGGLVQLWPRSDTTLVYITATDSLGSFVLRAVPPGNYVLRGVSDDNNNRGLDRREAWDTVGITLGDSAKVSVYAFVHDSLGARLMNAAYRDSVTLELSFDNPLSISSPMTPANVRIKGFDSTDVGVLSVTPPPPDTTAAVRNLGRPVPPRSVLVKLSRPLRTGLSYRIRVTDVHNLMGIARSGEIIFKAPAPTAPNPAAVPPAAPPPAPTPVKKRRTRGGQFRASALCSSVTTYALSWSCIPAR